MSLPPRVTVVAVCYESSGVVPGLLASVPAGVPVVLVDNASSDGPALEALARARGARLIRNDRNLGFGSACNLGADAAETEFVLFLNPDARLAEDALPAMLAAADRRPGASAIAPRILDSRGRPAVKRSSRLLRRRKRLPPGGPRDGQEVSVASGAALLVRRTAFEEVGGFDPAIFLYHEDDDLSLRLRREAGPIVFAGDAVVTHAGGGSSVRSPAVAALKGRHMGRSMVYVTRKHGVLLAWPRAFASALAQALLPWNWLSARKRAKHQALLAGVLEARGEGAAPRGGAQRDPREAGGASPSLTKP